MNVNRILQIQEEDAVKTFRCFMATWWEHVKLDAMFAPVEQPDQTAVSLRVLTDPGELELVNPFAPIMLINSAAAVESFMNDHPGKRLAAIMRPCELRTLVELQKRHKVFSHFKASNGSDINDHMTIIGVDCPGTYSVEEYSRRVVSQGMDGLTREALSFNAENGTMPGNGIGHLRPACDLCDRPAPLGADIVIGSLGVAKRGYLLAITSDEETDQRLHLPETTDAIATEEQVIQREFAIGAVVNQRALRRKEISGNGGSTHQEILGEKNIISLLGLFANCTLCADCLDACPLYNGELEGMLGINRAHQGGRPLLPELVGVSRWLVSCSGCGMCQEACEHSTTLAQLISIISHRLRGELHYTAGDPLQPLPWEAG